MLHLQWMQLLTSSLTDVDCAWNTAVAAAGAANRAAGMSPLAWLWSGMPHTQCTL